MIRFGLIGLGLMGREFASAVARWCHLILEGPDPFITAICDTNRETWKWFLEHFPGIKIKTTDYNDLLASEEVDAVYCAVPHNLHEQLYCDIIHSGKHLLGEKTFGIDLKANNRIIEAVQSNPGLVVRCSSEFPYFPACQRLICWLMDRKYGSLMEVKAGFHHSSDMDLSKPINWKRMIDVNGEYGCMGDLGMHTLHIPFRMGWLPLSVYADLQNIARTRPDGKGKVVECQTWDNAVLTCRCRDPETSQEFSMVVETKRMAPGATNNWFIEVYGTEGSAKFSTHDPKAFLYLVNQDKSQGWTRCEMGSQSAIPSITGGIFEFGFSDAFQQMIGAFLLEFVDRDDVHPFGNVTPLETQWSHRLFTAALESHEKGKRVLL